MLVIVVNNIILILLTLAIVFVAPLMIAYSGFLFVVNPVNAGGKEKAKSILTNTIVGIVVALAGWLIVDALMAVLYNANATSGTTTLGTWNSIITSGGSTQCLEQIGSRADDVPNQADPRANTTGSYLNLANLNSIPANKTGTACDPAVVMAGAAAGGYTLTNAQANTLACIAAPESSCGTNLRNFNWGKGSSAYGAFQVLLQSNAQCYENPACYSVPGVNASMSNKLNCAAGFRGGNPIPGSTIVDQCVRAASNINCSTSAAACLLKQNGGSFSPWQADVNNARQTGCISG